MFVPKTAKDFQDKMDQFKKAAAGFKGKVGDNVFFFCPFLICNVQNLGPQFHFLMSMYGALLSSFFG